MASNTTAQSVLAEITQDHLECPICNERFKQPKLLECTHSFCLECLQQLRENSPSTTKLSCPVCRQETVLKENGIEGLKTDFKTISLMAAFEKQETQLKQQEKQVHSKEVFSKCSKHTEKDLILYCDTCKKLICTTCITKDHSMHPAIELNEVLHKSKHHAQEMLSEVDQRIKSFNNAIQEIDMQRKTLDSMFAATKEKISKKADQEIAKEVARITGEQDKLMQEAEQIYQDRVKTMETTRATNSKKMNKAQHKQVEVYQLMDQGSKIVYHIEQLLQGLKEYRDMTSTKLPDGLTYMNFKEGQKSLGRLVQKYEQQQESATYAEVVQYLWKFKSEKKTYQNRKKHIVEFSAKDVAVHSNSDIVVSESNSAKLFTISAESNPQSTVIPQELPIKGLTEPRSVTVNKNDELIVLGHEAVKLFNRNYQLVHQFRPGSQPTCIAVDDNNLMAVGYCNKAEISLYKPDGSLIRTLPAPGIGRYLTIHKQQLIYTNSRDRKLVSVDYNGDVVFSVDTPQSGKPRGVCCDMDGSMYVGVMKGSFLSPSAEIHQCSPHGKYIGCIIKDCVTPFGMTVTPAGDLVVAGEHLVQIYHHEKIQK